MLFWNRVRVRVRVRVSTDSSEIVRNANVCRKKCAEKPLHGSSSAKTTAAERGQGGLGEWLRVCVQESALATAFAAAGKGTP